VLTCSQEITRSLNSVRHPLLTELRATNLRLSYFEASTIRAGIFQVNDFVCTCAL